MAMVALVVAKIKAAAPLQRMALVAVVAVVMMVTPMT
tara:strand:- start:243 stop:353 length:111 start_codon:yes stop_codon:yes gene_type:complete